MRRSTWRIFRWIGSYHLPKWYIGSAFCSGYILYYLFEVGKRPELACSEGAFKDFIQKNVPLLQEKFWPTFWCIEARAQTIMASVVQETTIPHICYRREILTLKDGGEVCLDWLEPLENCAKHTPTVIILPGLTGTSQAAYIKGLVLAGKCVGIRSVVFHQRGICGIPLKTPRTFCATNSEDLVEVIDHVRNVCPDAPVAATGISMGGLILGNYIASFHQETEIPLACAMLISVPWDVLKGTKSIEKPVVNLLLNRYLASCLGNVVKNGRQVLESGPYAIDEVLKSKTIREFDGKFTVKQFGFKDVNDYYEQASLHNKIDKFKIPVLCLSSADDPYQPYDGIPVSEANKSSNVGIVVTSRGGHIGFMNGVWPMYQNQYMFKLFAQFFESMLIAEGYKHLTK